jgi:16S rRNA (cytosine967-C5)-methyltransferase
MPNDAPRRAVFVNSTTLLRLVLLCWFHQVCLLECFVSAWTIPPPTPPTCTCTWTCTTSQPFWKRQRRSFQQQQQQQQHQQRWWSRQDRNRNRNTILYSQSRSQSSETGTVIDEFPPQQQNLQELALTWAADSLEPVLAGERTAEKALKRRLRSLSSTNNHININNEDEVKCYCSFSTEEQRWLRSQLAELILGTSIMRRRYEYILWNATSTTSSTTSTLSLADHNNRTSMARAMVEYHHNNKKNNHDNDNDTSESSSTDTISIVWPADPAERLSVQYSLPLFLVHAWVEQYGVPDTEDLCAVSNQPGPCTLRRNTLRCHSDRDLMDRLQRDENVTVAPLESLYLTTSSSTSSSNSNSNPNLVQPTPPPGSLRVYYRPPHRSIWSWQAWKEGWFEVQDTGSQCIVQATQVQAGDTVVDYCAGNGGKTLALASSFLRMDRTSSTINNTSTTTTTTTTTTIWAHDVVDERIRQLQGSLRRVGLLEDAPSYAASSSIHIRTTTNATADLWKGMADVVLVDAPCSSSGVLRRRPSQRWDLHQEDVVDHGGRLPALQLEILRLASRLVKPGGRLVYATCSVLASENDHVVQAWEGEEAGGAWVPWEFDPHDADTNTHTTTNTHTNTHIHTPPHYQRLLPHKHDSDGFFIARWKRSE